MSDLPEKIKDRIRSLILERAMSSDYEDAVMDLQESLIVELWTEIKTLREALEFYADIENWHDVNKEVKDPNDMWGRTKKWKEVPSKARQDCGDAAAEAITASKERFPDD